MERVMGIEPTYPAWKAGVLPLNYTRVFRNATILSQSTCFVKRFFKKIFFFLRAGDKSFFIYLMSV